MKSKGKWMFMAACLGITLLGLYGCGYEGNDSSSGDVWTDEDVASFHFEIGAGNTGSIVDDEGLLYDIAGVSKDATGGIEANGGGGRIDRIEDSISPICWFDIPLTNGQTASGIQVVESSTLCNTPNDCIVCVKSVVANACHISCDGTVSVDDVALEDKLPVKLSIRYQYQSNMPSAAGGRILSGGKVLGWPEFNPADATNGTQYDLSGCDGSAGEMHLEPITGQSGEDASSWYRDFDIVDIGNGSCVLMEAMTAQIDLSPLNTAGAFVNFSSGQVNAGTRICDDKQNCPALTY